MEDLIGGMFFFVVGIPQILVENKSSSIECETNIRDFILKLTKMLIFK